MYILHVGNNCMMSEEQRSLQQLLEEMYQLILGMSGLAIQARVQLFLFPDQHAELLLVLDQHPDFAHFEDLHFERFVTSAV
jgi:hypothetical protein